MPRFVRFPRLASWLAGALALCGADLRAQDSLAEAWRILSQKRYVDLSHSFGPGSPVWSGFGQAVFTPAADPDHGRPYTVEQDGFRATQYRLVGQYGTHVDPPAHFSKGGATMDQIPLKDMILPLVVFDSTPLLAKDPNHAWSVDDILAGERVLGRVPAGAYAALRTEMYRDWTAHPERFLVEQRAVTAIGHESLDTDITEKMESETWLLGQGHFQIEVMAQLDQVPATGALLVLSWPKVQDGLGFPARAFAILP